MKWIEILRKGDYAVLQNASDTQYVLAIGYDPNGKEDQKWSFGVYFEYWNDNDRKVKQLARCIDRFREYTERDYISRSRMEEIATRLNDCIKGDDSYINLIENDMYDYERDFFGIHLDDIEELEITDDLFPDFDDLII